MNTRLADITVQQVLAAVATIAVVWAIAALTVHHFQVCGERSGAQHQVASRARTSPRAGRWVSL